jgi:ribosomal protein L40E
MMDMTYESKLLEHLKLNKPVEIPNTFKICDNCGATYPSHLYNYCSRCHNEKLREEPKIRDTV